MISAGGNATSPINCTMLREAGAVAAAGYPCQQRTRRAVVPAVPRAKTPCHTTRSLGVAHVAHHRRLGLQLVQHPLWQLQLAAVQVTCI